MFNNSRLKFLEQENAELRRELEHIKRNEFILKNENEELKQLKLELGEIIHTAPAGGYEPEKTLKNRSDKENVFLRLILYADADLFYNL